MRVELLAVGTELLLGDIVNGNAAWLGRRLADVGLDVHGSTVVGDNVPRISAALRRGLELADGVLVTGGLGPTQDDVTREALASVAGVGLQRDRRLEEMLRRRYAELGRNVPDRNYRQADVPDGAYVLPNARGTAPGLRLEINNVVVYAMPGVPHEMEAMFDSSVLPDLLTRAGQPAAIVSRVLRTAGMWESVVAERLAPLVDRLDATGNPTIAFLASGGQVAVRLTAKAADRGQAEELLVPVEQAARAALGSGVYGVDGDTLDGVVHRLLAAGGATVAVAESLTGGLLGAALTQLPGSSATFRGGVTAYATDLKETTLGVPAGLLASSGAVSGDVAQAMAVGVRDRLGATYGLALTGVAGPEEQDGQPVGTVWAALAGPEERLVRLLRLPGDRSRTRQLAVVSALDLLRRHLSKSSEAGNPGVPAMEAEG
jgi:nicotinamide-nucleotide amidase